MYHAYFVLRNAYIILIGSPERRRRLTQETSLVYEISSADPILNPTPFLEQYLLASIV
jgi:hypothetical protein